MSKSMLHKTALIVLSAGLFLSLGSLSGQAKTKVRSYQNIKNATYQVTNWNATVYSSANLAHKKGKLGTYGPKVTGYYAAHVSKNGKSSIYYKFKVGKKTGWVWHGYLKKAVPSEKFSEAKTDARFLTLINDHRKKGGIAPVTLDNDLFKKVTLTRAKQIETKLTHTDKAGNFIAADLASDAGINFGYFTENIAQGNWTGNNKTTADDIFNLYFYHDADSDWGHRDNIMSPEVTRVAVASIYKNGNVYNVMNFYSPMA